MNKQDAIQHLIERRKFFLDKGLFGRAETMKEIAESIEKQNDNFDFSTVLTVGLHIEPQPYSSNILYI